MGFFDGKSYSTGEIPRMHQSSSHSHARSSTTRRASPSRSSSGWVRPSGGASSSYSTSRGFFGGSSNHGGASYYKRRPRDGYIQYLLHKLQRMFKELWYYAKRNPIKAFFAVVVPLLSAGGAIHGLLRQFGVRIPLVDGQTRRYGGGYYGSQGYGGRSGSSGSGGGGWMDNAGSLLQVAKMFM